MGQISKSLSDFSEVVFTKQSAQTFGERFQISGASGHKITKIRIATLAIKIWHRVLDQYIQHSLSHPSDYHFCYQMIISNLVTWPNTTCLPSSHWVLAVQRKNCDPLVLGPALAMDRTPTRRGKLYIKYGILK